MSRSGDFCAYDRRQTQLITSPLAHAHGVIKGLALSSSPCLYIGNHAFAMFALKFFAGAWGTLMTLPPLRI